MQILYLYYIKYRPFSTANILCVCYILCVYCVDLLYSQGAGIKVPLLASNIPVDYVIQFKTILHSIKLVSRKWSIFDKIQIIYLQIINNRPFSTDYIL